MVIQDSVFMEFVGLNNDLACQIVDVERAVPLALHPKNRSFFLGNLSPIRSVPHC
jgi:hypothetical protein